MLLCLVCCGHTLATVSLCSLVIDHLVKLSIVGTGYPDFHIHVNSYDEVCVDTLINMFVFWYIIILFFAENFNRVIYCELFCLCYIYVRGKRVVRSTLEYK